MRRATPRAAPEGARLKQALYRSFLRSSPTWFNAQVLPMGRRPHASCRRLRPISLARPGSSAACAITPGCRPSRKPARITRELGAVRRPGQPQPTNDMTLGAVHCRCHPRQRRSRPFRTPQARAVLRGRINTHTNDSRILEWRRTRGVPEQVEDSLSGSNSFIHATRSDEPAAIALTPRGSEVVQRPPAPGLLKSPSPDGAQRSERV